MKLIYTDLIELEPIFCDEIEDFDKWLFDNRNVDPYRMGAFYFLENEDPY